jgi:hypothetical protein
MRVVRHNARVQCLDFQNNQPVAAAGGPRTSIAGRRREHRSASAPGVLSQVSCTYSMAPRSGRHQSVGSRAGARAGSALAGRRDTCVPSPALQWTTGGGTENPSVNELLAPPSGRRTKLTWIMDRYSAVHRRRDERNGQTPAEASHRSHTPPPGKQYCWAGVGGRHRGHRIGTEYRAPHDVCAAVKRCACDGRDWAT